MTPHPKKWSGGPLMTSLRQDWRTPRQLALMLDREFHFHLDVCATPRDTLAPRWFHRAEDALQQDWLAVASGTIWMNPPYGKVIGDWVQRAHEVGKSETVVCLLPARTDTSWWHDYCLKAREIRFLRGRLCFDDAKRKRAPFPSVLVIFGPAGKS